MQELKPRGLPPKAPHDAGSALVSAVAFSIVLFIASLGYIQLLASSRNIELESLRDDRAFMAAESGLFLGARWLSQQQDLPGADSTPVYGDIPFVYDKDTIKVDVAIIKTSSTEAIIRSAARSAMLRYKKRLSWSMAIRGPGSYGVYLNNAYVFGGNTHGIRKNNWDGPVHFNTALMLGNGGTGNNDHFDSRVTLYNNNPKTNLPVIDAGLGIGHFGNDYTRGIGYPGAGGYWDATVLDTLFQSTYYPYAQKIAVRLDTSNSTRLYVNAGDPSLTFGESGGKPCYSYKNTAGNVTAVTYDPAAELKLRIVNNDVSVSGTMQGKVTVYTDSGKNVYLPGDLTYKDFSTSSFSSTDTAGNFGFGRTSPNILGIYSGGNITVSDGTHNITSLLFAVIADSSTINFERDKPSTTFNLFGELAASGFWDSKQGNDQATIVQLWDRRTMWAPGIGYKLIMDNGQQGLLLTKGSWQETNFK